MLDLVLIVLSLPLWLPLMILLAAATWVLSPGPIIFRQERIGLGGRRFAMYKFRTMTVDAGSAEHADHVRHLVESDRPLSKLDEAGDSRLIRFGRVIRASGLDELPQILNVLRGEMSLIGPRPCLPGEADLFDRWHAERMLAMPGITGLWQVSGKNKTTFSQMIALDIEYRRRLSPALDLSILVRTIPAIVAQIRDLTGGSMTRQGHPLSHRYTDVAGELPAK
jgi:lipopolysaccharide/colanic/teichoic acid biosynthesis glycosyltransferase